MYKQYKEDPKQTLENYKKALSLGSSQSIKEVYDAMVFVLISLVKPLKN